MIHIIRACLLGVLCFTLPAFAQIDLKLQHQIPIETPEITTVAFSEDSSFVAAGTSRGEIYFIEAESGEILHKLQDRSKAITAITISHSADYLVAASSDKKIAIWNLKDSAQLKHLEDFGKKAWHLRISPDDRTLVACGERKEIYLWEFPSGYFKGELKGHKKDVIFTSFGTRSDELVSVGKDGRIIWWDLSKLKSVRTTEIDIQTMPNSGIDVKSASSDTRKRFIAVGLDEQVLEKGGRSMKFKYTVAFYDWRDGSLRKLVEGNRKSIEAIQITGSDCQVVLDNSTLQQSVLSFWNIPSSNIDYDCKLPGRIFGYALGGSGNWMAAAVVDDRSDHTCWLNLWQLTFETSDLGCLIGKFTITSSQEPLIREGKQSVVAVMPFDCTNLSEEFGQSIPRFLEGKLVNSPYVRLVERSKIDEITGELEFQDSKYVEREVAKIGKILGAHYLILGSIDKLESNIVVSAKLIDTETAEITGVREVVCEDCGPEEIFEAAGYLAPVIAEF